MLYLARLLLLWSVKLFGFNVCSEAGFWAQRSGSFGSGLVLAAYPTRKTTCRHDGHIRAVHVSAEIGNHSLNSPQLIWKCTIEVD